MYSSSQYLLRIGAKEGFATSKIVNVGSEKKVGKATVNNLESMLKSGTVDEWKFVISHPKLFTDSFYVAPSSYMTLDGTLKSRPNITGQVLDVFNMVGEDGNRKIVDGRFIPEVGINGMKVFLSSDTANNVVTSNGGYFSLRPHLIEGTLDTLYIINHLNSVSYYQTVRPFKVKTGEILDVNGRPSALLSMPVQEFAGVDGANNPLTEDLLFAYRYIADVKTMVYPDYPQYNGSIINIDLLGKTHKIFLDRGDAKEQTNPLEPYYTAKQYSDTVLGGFRLHEVVPGVRFVETHNKEESDIEVIFFDKTDYNQNHYVHTKLGGGIFSEKGWNITKVYVYLQTGRSLGSVARSAAHELTHAIAHNRDEGHSNQKGDRYGVLPSLDSFIGLSNKDIAISKLCLWPLPNSNLTYLVLETRYDKK